MVEKMSFLIKNSEVWEKYEDIQDVIKNKLGIKFHSEPIYENKYLKTKVRAFDCSIKTNFLSKNLQKKKKKYSLYMYCLYNSSFCLKNEQKKLSTSLFRRV